MSSKHTHNHTRIHLFPTVVLQRIMVRDLFSLFSSLYSLLRLLPLNINISSGNYIQQTAQNITCHYTVNDNAESERQNEKARGSQSFDNNKSNNNEDREEYEIPPAYRLPQNVYSVSLPFISFSSRLLYSSFSNVWKHCIIDNVSSQIMKD